MLSLAISPCPNDTFVFCAMAAGYRLVLDDVESLNHRAESGEFDVTVPAGYLWVMGDHRSVSSDSRCQKDVERFVPEDLVRGKAVVVIWPGSHWRLLRTPDAFDAVS